MLGLLTVQRISKTDVAGLIIAIFLVIGGFVVVIWPHEAVVQHAGTGKGPTTYEHVTALGARIYGLVSIASGMGLAALIWWGARSHDDLPKA